MILTLTANGPAIWGGWVTRRKHRAPASWRRSRGYKFDRSRESIPGYMFGGGHWRSVAVQIVSEPEISHGTELLLGADARVRVQELLRICLGSRSRSKKCDKQLTHIVRVISRVFI